MNGIVTRHVGELHDIHDITKEFIGVLVNIHEAHTHYGFKLLAIVPQYTTPNDFLVKNFGLSGEQNDHDQLLFINRAFEIQILYRSKERNSYWANQVIKIEIITLGA